MEALSHPEVCNFVCTFHNIHDISHNSTALHPSGFVQVMENWKSPGFWNEILQPRKVLEFLFWVENHWKIMELEKETLRDSHKQIFCSKLITKCLIIIRVFLERLSMWNMVKCAEQVQIQKYKTYALYKTLKTVGVQIIMLKHPK